MVPVFLTIVAILILPRCGQAAELSCSAYDFELKTMNLVIRQQIEMEKFEKKMKEWQKLIDTQFVKLANAEEERETRTKEGIDAGLVTLKQHTEQWKREMLSFQESRKEMNENISTALSEFNVKLEEHIKEPGEINKKQDRQVAFTVHTPTRTLVSSVPTFRTILVNTGGGYNKDTGRFTCPVSGLYLFTVTLLAHYSRSGDLYCTLYKDGTITARAYSHEGPADSASMTLFLQLSQGDHVDLKCGNNWNNVAASYRTVYSGALVRAD